MVLFGYNINVDFLLTMILCYTNIKLKADDKKNALSMFAEEALAGKSSKVANV